MHSGILICILALTSLANSVPLDEGQEKPLAIWQLEIFVENVLQEFKANLSPELDPILEVQDIRLDMTFPHYLILAGDVRNMSFQGLREFTIKSMTSSSYSFTVYINIYSILEGLHNLHGTITLDDGTIVPIGSATHPSLLRLLSAPAEMALNVNYRVEPNGFVQITGSSWMNLRPYSSDGSWNIDFSGLLDPITDQSLLENAIYWISLEIVERERVQDNIADFIEHRMLTALQSAFDEKSWDDIIGSPPSTAPPGPLPRRRISIEVRPPRGVVLLKCTSPNMPDQGPTLFNTTGGDLTWEWEENHGTLMTWTCWANWGKAVLARFVDVGGLRLHQGFLVYGSSLVETVPRQNNTWPWLLDGFGKARVFADGMTVRDHLLMWDGDVPS